jgi:tape measure domain-containing protein
MADINVSIGAKTTEFDASLSKLKTSTKNATSSMQSSFGGLTGTFAAVGAAAGVISVGLYKAYEAISSFAEASMELMRVSRAMMSLGSSASEAAASIAFLRQTSSDLSVDFNSLTRNYISLAAAFKQSNMSLADAENLMLNVSTAAKALSLSSDTTSRAFQALQQMVSKGKVSMEELRGQLGEALPGAMGIAAKAYGVNTQELGKMVEKGLDASDFVKRFSAQLNIEYGDALKNTSQTTEDAANRMGNAWSNLKAWMAESTNGILTTMRNAAAAMMDFISGGNEMQRLQKDITSLESKTRGPFTDSYLNAELAEKQAKLSKLMEDQNKAASAREAAAEEAKNIIGSAPVYASGSGDKAAEKAAKSATRGAASAAKEASREQKQIEEDRQAVIKESEDLIRSIKKEGLEKTYEDYEAQREEMLEKAHGDAATEAEVNASIDKARAEATLEFEKELADAVREMHVEAYGTDAEQELEALIRKYEKMFEMAVNHEEELKQLKESYNAEQGNIIEKYEKKTFDAQLENEMDMEKASADAQKRRVNLAATTGNQLSTIGSALMQATQEQGGMAFEASKGIAAAGCIMSTAAGAMKAFEQMGVFGWVGAAAIIATGAVQLATILSTSATGGGEVSGLSASIPTSPVSGVGGTTNYGTPVAKMDTLSSGTVINVTIEGDAISDSEYVDRLCESISKAVVQRNSILTATTVK